MPRESRKLATTRAEAAEAALAASFAARDANAARELMERSLEDLHMLVDAVESLNQGITLLNEQITELQSADILEELAALTRRVDDLARGTKKIPKGKKMAE